jgi:3-hydroxy-9,10-secoandrosta-1,3,5(10)-triene-9,17-dione monooxygenase reductase component
MSVDAVPIPHPADPAAFRQVLGTFCSGVTVVAALSPTGPLGLTCQAFASLSLAPPLIMFSPARSSATWPKIRQIGRFCVSILAEEHQKISVQMSRSGTDKFAGVRWQRTPLGAPRLVGAAAWLDCTLEAEHYGGDHTIVIAAVHYMAADQDTRPLLFHQGRYATLQRPSFAKPSFEPPRPQSQPDSQGRKRRP